MSKAHRKLSWLLALVVVLGAALTWGTSSKRAIGGAIGVTTRASPTTPRPARSHAAPRSTSNDTATQPCATNQDSQLVLVSIVKQHMWLCERSHLVSDTPVTTGIPSRDTSTPVGQSAVEQKVRDMVLRPSDGTRYRVKYWIPWDNPDYGFHDSSWQTIPYGSDKYKTGGSHGCVHVPLQAMTFLFDWVQLGATVIINN